MLTISGLALRLHRDLGTTEDWACIAQSLGFSELRQEQRDALWRRLRNIFQVYFKPNQPPDWRVANLTRALKRLEQDVERLRNDLSFSWTDEDDGVLAKIEEIYETAASDEEIEERRNALTLNRAATYEARAPFTNFNDNEAFAWSVDTLLPKGERVAVATILDKLMADIDAYRQQLGDDKGGDLPDWRSDHAIRALAWFYYDHTRKKPGISRNLRGSPGGPFLRFVKAVFQVFVPGRLKGDEALVKRIRRVSKQKWPGANQGN
jgi:hypothetical protein